MNHNKFYARPIQVLFKVYTSSIQVLRRCYRGLHGWLAIRTKFYTGATQLSLMRRTLALILGRCHWPARWGWICYRALVPEALYKYRNGRPSRSYWRRTMPNGWGDHPRRTGGKPTQKTGNRMHANSSPRPQRFDAIGLTFEIGMTFA